MIEQSVTANGDLLSHELGHHWWGDLVAPTIHNHMWIKEGPAEYSSHLFVEYKDGHEAFVDFVKDNQQFVLEECHIQDEGFIPFLRCRTHKFTGAPRITRARLYITISEHISVTNCTAARASP